MNTQLEKLGWDHIPSEYRVLATSEYGVNVTGISFHKCTGKVNVKTSRFRDLRTEDNGNVSFWSNFSFRHLKMAKSRAIIWVKCFNCVNTITVYNEQALFVFGLACHCLFDCLAVFYFFCMQRFKNLGSLSPVWKGTFLLTPPLQ